MAEAFSYGGKCETCEYFSSTRKGEDDYMAGSHCAIQTFLTWREGGAWITAQDTQAKRASLDIAKKQYQVARLPVANGNYCVKYKEKDKKAP